MNTAGLLPYQVEPAQCLNAALSLHGAAIDASECGIGKTFHAAAVIRERELPTLVVCPKISATGWRRAMDLMGTSADVNNYEMLSTGRTPYGRWENPKPKPADRLVEYHCECCQCKVDLRKPVRCHAQPSGIHCVHPKKVPHDYGKFIWSDAIQLLIFDEAHVCGGLDSLNADMMTAAKRQGIKTIALSATAADSPLGFKALGYLLGLHCGPACFYNWARVRGCSRPPFGGLHFLVSEDRKKEIMARIHADIFPSRGVRVRKSDIPGFPTCQVTAELYDLENSGKIDELYAQMDTAIQQLNEIKLGDVCAENPLTILLRASQQIELLKVPLFLALREEALAAGHSVAIFVAFTQTLEEIMRRGKISACIRGDQKPGERQHWIDQFQANHEHTIVANIAAGGISVSLHDLHGRPRTGFASLHPSAVKMRQVFGRLPRAGALSPSLYRIPLVAGTCEEKTHRRLVSRLNSMDALNDADLCATNLPLTHGDICQLLGI